MVDDQAGPELVRLLRQLRRRDARRRGGPELTYREIAARTGWSLGIVAHYFSGKTLPPVDRFDELIRLLGAAPAEQGRLATVRDRADEQRRGRDAPPPRRPAALRADIRLLGPVEVLGPGGRAALVGRRQRALVGLLGLSPARVVSQSRLVDALWGEDPPRTAVPTLYSHIARVRRALDGCGLRDVLLSRDSGYILAVSPDEVDADRFERQVISAQRMRDKGRAAEASAALRDALALWRGDPLAGAATTGWAAAAVDRLHELRQVAFEDLALCRLRLGEHAEVVADLKRLVVRWPGREGLVELLMLALERCGRHAEALEAYQRLRAHLAEHLGARPSPRLSEVYTAVLRRNSQLDAGRESDAAAAVRPTASSRPAQLPPAVGPFAGRRAEMATLGGLGGRHVQVGLVCGPAGIGKTALAVRWAHRVAGRFPDGQLFLDLRGHDPKTAMPVSEVLAHLLRGLDVPASQISTDRTELVSRYRSAMHGRRILVLLDNAADTDQVTLLVPPSPTGLLLVTSRQHLAGLAVDHAVMAIRLDALASDDSLTLLRRALDQERVAREPSAAAELVELCGGMPLALRIAAAKIAADPHRRIADLVSHLRGADRLAGLAVADDSRSIRAVFTSAYDALRPDAARLFRRLGQHPGGTFTLALAAAVAGTPTGGVRGPLGELVCAHLVADLGDGRYRFHDLIRLYAAERAKPAEITTAAARITGWYLTVADSANRIFDPVRDRAGPVVVDPPVEVPILADHEAALSFMDQERSNLPAVVQYAAAHGHDRSAWQLAYLLTSYHMLRGLWPTQLEICRAGLAAAQRLADEAAEALLSSLLGMACNATRRREEALAHLNRGLVLSRAMGDRRGEGMALNNIALAFSRLGQRGAAIAAFEQALATHTAQGHAPGIALALNNLGHEHTLGGSPDQAMSYLSQALTLARELGNAALEAMTLDSIGQAQSAAGDFDDALHHLAAALAIRCRLGERRGEVETLIAIGLTHRNRGDEPAAAARLRQALRLSRDLGDRGLEAAARDHLCRATAGAMGYGPSTVTTATGSIAVPEDTAAIRT